MENVTFLGSSVNWIFAAVIVVLFGAYLWKAYRKSRKKSQILKYIRIALPFIGIGCSIAITCYCIIPTEHRIGIATWWVCMLLGSMVLGAFVTDVAAPFANKWISLLLIYSIALSIIDLILLITYICSVDSLTWSKLLLRILLFVGSLCFIVGIYIEAKGE